MHKKIYLFLIALMLIFSRFLFANAAENPQEAEIKTPTASEAIVQEILKKVRDRETTATLKKSLEHEKIEPIFFEKAELIELENQAPAKPLFQFPRSFKHKSIARSIIADSTTLEKKQNAHATANNFEREKKSKISPLFFFAVAILVVGGSAATGIFYFIRKENQLSKQIFK